MSLKEQFGKDILLTGWGHSRFGKLTDDTLESLIVQVASEAIGNSGLDPKDIDEIYLGPVQLRHAAAGIPVLPGASVVRGPCQCPGHPR